MTFYDLFFLLSGEILIRWRMFICISVETACFFGPLTFATGKAFNFGS